MESETYLIRYSLGKKTWELTVLDFSGKKHRK